MASTDRDRFEPSIRRALILCLSFLLHSVSADATTLYYIDRSGILNSIESEGGAPRVVTKDNGRYFLFVSAEHLVFFKKGTYDLCALSIKDGREQLITESDHLLDPIGFSRDGSMFAFTDRAGRFSIYRFSDGTLIDRPLFEGNSRSNFFQQRFWTMDGRLAVYLLTSETVHSPAPGMAPKKAVHRIFEYRPADDKWTLIRSAEHHGTDKEWFGDRGPDTSQSRQALKDLEVSFKAQMAAYDRYIPGATMTGGLVRRTTRDGKAEYTVSHGPGWTTLQPHDVTLSVKEGSGEVTTVKTAPLIQLKGKPGGSQSPVESPRWLPGDKELLYYEYTPEHQMNVHAVWIYDRGTKTSRKILDHGVTSVCWHEEQ